MSFSHDLFLLFDKMTYHECVNALNGFEKVINQRYPLHLNGSPSKM